MSCVLTNRTTDGMGEAHVCAAGANVTTRPMPSLRFWIITMMLVLFGLSTLKLR
jgi:UDP-N-acetylmuramyl pentapeptide phosphotransferase/UDP-N-acetylglucosamine-1-phosphate transferase